MFADVLFRGLDWSRSEPYVAATCSTDTFTYLWDIRSVLLHKSCDKKCVSSGTVETQNLAGYSLLFAYIRYKNVYECFVILRMSFFHVVRKQVQFYAQSLSIYSNCSHYSAIRFSFSAMSCLYVYILHLKVH